LIGLGKNPSGEKPEAEAFIEENENASRFFAVVEIRPFGPR